MSFTKRKRERENKKLSVLLMDLRFLLFKAYMNVCKRNSENFFFQKKKEKTFCDLRKRAQKKSLKNSKKKKIEETVREELGKDGAEEEEEEFSSPCTTSRRKRKRRAEGKSGIISIKESWNEDYFHSLSFPPPPPPFPIHSARRKVAGRKEDFFCFVR